MIIYLCWISRQWTWYWTWIWAQVWLTNESSQAKLNSRFWIFFLTSSSSNIGLNQIHVEFEFFTFDIEPSLNIQILDTHLSTLLLLFHPCCPNLPADKLVYPSYIRSMVHPFDLHDCWSSFRLNLDEIGTKKFFFW